MAAPIYPGPAPRRVFAMRAAAGLGLLLGATACVSSEARSSGTVHEQGAEPLARPAPQPTPLPSTGDAQLDALRQLARNGTIEALLENIARFVSLHSLHYGSDPVLWHGIERLARHLLDSGQDHPAWLHGIVAQQIEGNSPPTELELAPLAAELRRIEAIKRSAQPRERAPERAAPTPPKNDGAATSSPATAAPANPAPVNASTGDATLDELRRLATEAPIMELRAKAPWWFNLRGSGYLEDPVLWRGIDRMSHEVVTNPDHGFHPFDVLLLINCIKRGTRPESQALRLRLPALERALQRIRTETPKQRHR